MKKLFRTIAFLILLFFIYLSFRYLDVATIKAQAISLWKHPQWWITMTLLYLLAFVCRAWAWKEYVHQPVPFVLLLHALFYSLLINHLLPIKLGDVARIGILRNKVSLKWDEAAHSVVMMRSLDLLVIGCIAAIGAFVIGLAVSLWMLLIFVAVGMCTLSILYMYNKRKETFFHKHFNLCKQALSGMKGVRVLCLVVCSWLLEAIVVLGVIRTAAHADITIVESVWVNSFTIAGQVFQMTPGGIGNYESAMSLALVSLGFSGHDAYAAAVVSHLFKFIFAYVLGLYVMFKMPIKLEEFKTWFTTTRGQSS